MIKARPTVSARKPWIRPVVEKIAAGQAEVGTTKNGETTFASS